MVDLNGTLAFACEPTPHPREVRVNFGVFAGRSATAAEIDDLARTLAPEVEPVTILAEERYELGGSSATTIHQVRIELPDGADADRVVALAEAWARACIAERRAEVTEQ
jgi:hypothetical protein